MRAARKLARLALIGFDVDGVLTDGTLWFSPRGEELKPFSSLDGHGMKLLRESGVAVAIVSGRSSEALARRAENLGVTELHMGVTDKVAAMRGIAARLGIGLEHAGYMGDDIVDLPVLRACGFSATTADAHPEVRARVDWVARAGGGRGAARELCDLVLRTRNAWDGVMAECLS